MQFWNLDAESNVQRECKSGVVRSMARLGAHGHVSATRHSFVEANFLITPEIHCYSYVKGHRSLSRWRENEIASPWECLSQRPRSFRYHVCDVRLDVFLCFAQKDFRISCPSPFWSHASLLRTSLVEGSHTCL